MQRIAKQLGRKLRAITKQQEQCFVQVRGHGEREASTARSTWASNAGYAIFTYDEETTGIVSAEDRHGNSISITASGIHHSGGKSIFFERDPQGRIKTITDPVMSQNSIEL